MQSGSAKLVVTNTASIPDTGSLALETLVTGQHGVLTVVEDTGNCAGQVYIRGAINASTILSDPLACLATSDTPGRVSIIADGDGTYTLKNNRGAARTYSLLYNGF
ncbi:MAG: hypothetical protein HZB91_08645 [Elusimicrobia bacterium]|nr:hypothetical protein [Elusimicrobiota bacterium]